MGAVRSSLLKEIACNAYGPGCVCCGEQEFTFLTIDHANNDGAAHRRGLGLGSRGGRQFYRELKRLGWPDNWGLRTLCYNCHYGGCRKGKAPPSHKGLKK